MANEIAVDLRLKLDKLKADARQAGEQINKDVNYTILARSLGKTSLGTFSPEFLQKNQALTQGLLANPNVQKKYAEQVKKIEEQGQKARMQQTGQLLGAAGLSIIMQFLKGPIGIAIVAIIGFKKALDEMTKSAESARMTYAKILQGGGLAPGFIIKQQQLAEIMGVGEKNVWQYGNAIAYLNKQLEPSTKILTKTNPVLTATGWQIKILDQNIKAFWAKLSVDAAPAIVSVVKLLDLLVRGLTGLHRLLISMSPLLAAYALLAPKVKPVPEAPISAERLPASAWEKMGMVIGQIGGQANHAKRTADNTATLVQQNKQLLNILGGTPRSGTNDFFKNPMYPQP